MIHQAQLRATSTVFPEKAGMVDNRILIVDAILREIAEELDIPPTKYKDAVDRYTAVGRWLEAGTYPGIQGTPTVYPQGSFRLGTVIRPIRHGLECEYDIDLVCQLNASLANVTPAAIKQMVGNRLKDHDTYRKMLDDEGRRCWTLIYAEQDGIGFHLDSLPCVPNPVVAADVQPKYAVKAIDLTNRNDPGKPYSWGKSNPAGFADWFADRQHETFTRLSALRKRDIQARYSRVFARVDDVPDQLVRTPLQRVIQILKRHRDIRFAGHRDEADKPISMIITTLAAVSYQQETDVYSTLANLLDNIQRYQDTGIIQCVNDKWLIPNPVNPAENFADRWNDKDSRKADAFFQWINWVREDIDEILNASTSGELETRLRRAFGDSPGRKVAAAYKGAMPGAQQPPRSLFQRVAGKFLRFDVAHRQSPQWHLAATRHKASISARYTRRGFRPTAFVSNSSPLPKRADLVFEAETDVPKPYSVHWQVVNTGDEAYRAGSLRGDFYESNKTGRTRTESTLYTGMHWVECFVVKNGVCVARSGEFVVNIA